MAAHHRTPHAAVVPLAEALIPPQPAPQHRRTLSPLPSQEKDRQGRCRQKQTPLTLRFLLGHDSAMFTASYSFFFGFSFLGTASGLAVCPGFLV